MDIELVAAGVLSLIAGAAWALRPDGSINWPPLVTFGALSAVSFFLAAWNVRGRGGTVVPWDR